MALSSSRLISSSAAAHAAACLAHDDVEADAEASVAGPGAAAASAAPAIFSATWAGGSPQVKYLSTCFGGNVDARADEPPK